MTFERQLSLFATCLSLAANGVGKPAASSARRTTRRESLVFFYGLLEFSAYDLAKGYYHGARAFVPLLLLAPLYARSPLVIACVGRLYHSHKLTYTKYHNTVGNTREIMRVPCVFDT